MAWGTNRGLLPAKDFLPHVTKGYQALAKNIQPTGMLGFVQKIGEAPDNMETTVESTEVYGSGAFLLADSEIVRMLDPTKRRSDVAKFDGVKLPEVFMPATPRAVARFVPERKDDFAWENDLVAFRTYGPSLRPGPENSGIDCWFKRVPYPVMDKWYIEDRLKLPCGIIAKPYHDDQGEGFMEPAPAWSSIRNGSLKWKPTPIRPVRSRRFATPGPMGTEPSAGLPDSAGKARDKLPTWRSGSPICADSATNSSNNPTPPLPSRCTSSMCPERPRVEARSILNPRLGRPMLAACPLAKLPWNSPAG